MDPTEPIRSSGIPLPINETESFEEPQIPGVPVTSSSNTDESHPIEHPLTERQVSVSSTTPSNSFGSFSGCSEDSTEANLDVARNARHSLQEVLNLPHPHVSNERAWLVIQLLTPFEKHLVKLIIDGDLLKQEKGWQAYENRQPGSIECMSRAWVRGLSDFCEHLRTDQRLPEITTSFLKKLHGLACPPSSYLSCSGTIHNTDPGLMFCEKTLDQERHNWQFFNLILTDGRTFHTNKGLKEAVAHRKHHASLLGIPFQTPFALGDYYAFRMDLDLVIDLLSELPNHLIDDYWEQLYKQLLVNIGKLSEQEQYKNKTAQLENIVRYILVRENRSSVVQFLPLEIEHQQKIVAVVLKEFNQALGKTTDLDSLLNVLVQYIPQLQQLHPFTDANGRLFHLLTQLILIFKGFPPLMMENPNQLALLDRNGLKQVILESMKTTLDYADVLFNSESESILHPEEWAPVANRKLLMHHLINFSGFFYD